MYVRPQTTQYNMLARTALTDENKSDFLQAIISRYNLSSVDESWKPYQLPDDSHVTYNSSQVAHSLHNTTFHHALSCIIYKYKLMKSYDILPKFIQFSQILFMVLLVCKL